MNIKVIAIKSVVNGITSYHFLTFYNELRDIQFYKDLIYTIPVEDMNSDVFKGLFKQALKQHFSFIKYEIIIFDIDNHDLPILTTRNFFCDLDEGYEYYNIKIDYIKIRNDKIDVVLGEE